MGADMTDVFDPCTPLEDGVTVLEASAGTGKTYAIAALATRAIALDDLPPDRLLAVTFTRAATGELRERIRERLARTETLLREGRTADGDEVDVQLGEGGIAEVRERSMRLRRALADFDAATIVTLHGFCQAVLGTLGVAGDLDADTAVVEEVDDLREQVLLDLFLRRFRNEAPMFSLKEARRIVEAAVQLPDVRVVPANLGEKADRAQTRARLAARAREELGARKRRARLLTFDDLLVRLRDALISDDGEALCARLRNRWDLVLVDEFQDTDPLQWEVLERSFVGSTTRLVLIGDPKQAIYAFRGADIHAYLSALGHQHTRRTLRTNWRSDQALIDAHDALLDGVQLGDPQIPYRTVKAHHAARRLHGAPDDSALRFRVVDRHSPAIVRTQAKNTIQVDSGREFVAADCGREIVALLSSGAEIDEPDGSRRPIRAGDIAVLCRKTQNARNVHEYLGSLGVRVVLAGAGSVFDTQAATDWLRLLEALERPGYEGSARLATLTPFFGWDAERLAQATPPDLESVHARLHVWARLLRSRGMAALAATIMATEQLPERVLAREGGERELTDLRHVAELLHRAGTADGLGATALATWLRRRIAEARNGDGDEARTRRLESDDLAVQVLTVHRAKGLEFPVVCLPDLWDIFRPPKEKPPAAFHENGKRVLDVGLLGREYEQHLKAHQQEERAEELRLFYVAITRARHQALVWWAGHDIARAAPLTRLLLDRAEDGAIGPGPNRTPDDAVLIEALEGIAARAAGTISVTVARPAPDVQLPEALQAEETLAVREFNRDIDWTWGRTSYSALAAGARERRAPVGSEVGTDLIADEPAEDELVVPPAGSALTAMPAGREVGTVIHAVLEQADFKAESLPEELLAHLEAVTTRSGIDLGDLEAIATDLTIALSVSVLGGPPLSSVPPQDRLDELAFELPLAGGDEPSGVVTLRRLAEALHSHLPDHHPVRPYADLLAAPELSHRFRGYLTGSIDLVWRWTTEDGNPRFALADYKTNRLGSYGHAVVHGEMQKEHYWLQALIYLVALHRHLRARQPGYDPDQQLAGAAYLFVRGMPDGGVAEWRPSGALLDALSEAFDG